MKKITLVLIIGSLVNFCFSQGTDVLSAEQFCSGTSQLTFNNVYGGSDNTQVGCLGTIPNAAYFYLEIDQPGDLIFNISQQDLGNNPIDVDFIVWGPFTDLTDADNTISFTDCPGCPSNTADPTFYPYLDTVPNPDSPIVDCSYDASPTETMNILNATQGEIYVVLITNYDGSEGTIDFSQTGGNGTTTCSNIPICGSQFYDTGGPTGGYFNNESYTTTINPYFVGGSVTVDFTEFNLGSGDVLVVYNGPNNTFPVLGTVVGAPSTFTSNTTGNPSGAISFEFTSDASGTSTGWAADISCSAPPPPPTCGTTFYDSGGASGDYSNNEYETTTYYPDTPGEVVTATFTAFNLEIFDDLYVFNGPNTSSPLLGVFNGTTIPGPFTSTDPSGALTFLFDSDSSVTYSGWSVDLTCAPFVPPVICGSTIYDSGGPSGNYGDNEFITTTLIPDVPNTSIVATFTFFDTELCCDELRVYDGPDATYPLLGTYAGNTLPPVLTSSDVSGALTFIFDSDFSITGGGYAANITCVNTCNLIITETNYPAGSDSCNLDYVELTTNALPPPPTTSIFSETFDGAGFPAGWTTTSGGPGTTWIISNTTNAGGAANEVSLDWSSGFDIGTWTLTSPAIDITGATNLQLGYSQELDHFSASYPYSIFVETSTDNTNWTIRYSVVNVSADIAANDFNHDISSHDGNTTLYIRYRFDGEAFGFFDWNIDNVEVMADGSPSPPQITWTPEIGLYTDITLTTPYITGNIAGTVYAAPNGVQVYTATDLNGCTDTATVTFNKKIWNGTTGNTDWNTATNWLPIGIPVDTNCITIPDTGGNDPIINGTTNGNGLNLTIENNAILTQQSNSTLTIVDFIELESGGIYTLEDNAIGNGLNLTIENGATLTQQSNSTLTIINFIDVNTGGYYTMEDSSSLIQVDDVANTVNGTFSMARTANMRQNDYVYWSTPTATFNIEDVSPGTPNGFKYLWLPFVVRPPGPPGPLDFGEWQAYNNGPMAIGKGYIIRGPSGHTAAPSPFTANFNGTPNNGEIFQPIQRSTYTGPDYFYQPNVPGDLLTVTSDDDNWNLIGNPYPSAINAIEFLSLPANSNIEGFVYLWTHGTELGTGNPDPFYNDYVYNYNAADYIAYNSSGTSTPTGFLGNIGAGQGFFVLMNDLATTSETVTFNNSMRSSSYANNQFYRTTEPETNSMDTINRIWLDYITPNDFTNTALIAYIEGATNEHDRMFDAKIATSNGLNLYSLINDDAYIIQGRQVPFEDTDVVPIGLNISEDGIQTIAIRSLEGLFLNDNTSIFIEDLYTGIIHNIKENPYFFDSEAGVVNDRLLLRYNAGSLDVNDQELSSGILVYSKQDKIQIESMSGAIESIKVYDVLGRSLFKKSNINRTDFRIEQMSPKTQVIFLKIVLVSGREEIVKLIF